MKYSKVLILIIVIILIAVGCMNIHKLSLTEDSFSSGANPADKDNTGNDYSGNVFNQEFYDRIYALNGQEFLNSLETSDNKKSTADKEEPDDKESPVKNTESENSKPEVSTSQENTEVPLEHLINIQNPSALNITQMSSEELIFLFSFLSHPIQGAKVSSVNGQLPNAPRTYRNGVHEGLDYYGGSCGVSVTKDTSVLAAGPGTVIRADHGFLEMTQAEYDEAIQISKSSAITPEDLLDKFRGMQIWIQHEHGIITRYAHLDSIDSSIQVGTVVQKGQKIGNTGNTGTRESVQGSGSGIHLHFEIWLNGSFLGKGKSVSTVRNIYSQALK
ncbi:M23 family metallopeptidase [Candidatus Contubernalis alkaliaceticus]|uniref:M23 family metallopeptidase n=1 Tax=Candidatus Contubernalis alkaliaceticus TaxID=338645 RepID=UPI001F4BE475|nr:M23 family metallopeptidase [Candidatus Contubernalis alkalaceticus]UNC92863.1 M23 family metallopeptidase [Candidatus Contubernalis alkalaceticus]